MKISNLFETSNAVNQWDNWTEKDIEIFEWFLIEGFKFGSDNLCKSFKQTKLSPIEWYKKNFKKIDSQFSDYYSNFKVENGIVSYSDVLYLYQLDNAPSPPKFKFGNVKVLEISNKCQLLTKLPDWLPEESECIEFFNTGITSIAGLDKIIKKCKELEFSVPLSNKTKNSIVKSGVLAVFNINGMEKITLPGADGQKVSKIVNKHLSDDNDIFACQDELIEAGFKEFATL